MAPCKMCEANDQPNCGHDWCHTRSDDEKVWVADCNVCGVREVTTWDEAIEDGCLICGTSKISIYHKKNLTEE